MSKKIINDFEDMVPELIEGFVEAYAELYEKLPDVNGIILRNSRKKKVSLVIGGGSGHEPLFSGFIGEGLADAAACGNLFVAPDPNTIYQTAKAVEEGRGILFVYGSYAGDNLNFDVAEEYLRADGIETAHVRVHDDVVSAPVNRMEDRRGIAGDIFVIKVAGAACDCGLDLKEVCRITAKARDNTRSIGLATTVLDLPGSEQSSKILGENEIEYGMGLHGERGLYRTYMQPADILTDRMYNQICLDFDIASGDEVCVLVNSLGSTSIAELAIVFRRLKQLMDQDGIRVYDSHLNYFCTSQGIGGFSITVFKLDEELKKYYDMPCFSPYFAKREKKKHLGDQESYPAPARSDRRPAELLSYVPKERDGILDEMDAMYVRDMLIYVAEYMISKEDYLSELDRRCGDGDHGIVMAGGMKSVYSKLEQIDETSNIYEVFELAGRTLLFSMGGVAGVLFGNFFLAGARGMKKKEILTSEDFAEMAEKSLQAIQRIGKAKVGDKTMVDALFPAVAAIRAHRDDGLLKMLRAAEQAAGEGAEKTREYTAKFGRGRLLMDSVIGYLDAGAVSIWLIFKSMREFVEGVEE